jgi:hypothetical protein
MKEGESDILYVSLDMERAGDWPDKHFVTEIGVVGFSQDGKEISSLQLFLSEEEGKCWDPTTLLWYKNNGQYKRWESEQEAADISMKKLQSWLKITKKSVKAEKHVFICAPTIADGKWLSILWFRYLGHPCGNPRYGPGFTYIDIRSFASGKLDKDIFDCKKSKALAPFRPDENIYPHTHLASDDAREQGILFFNIKNKKVTV